MKILLFLMIGATLNSAKKNIFIDCNKKRKECNEQMCSQSVEAVQKCKRDCIVAELKCTVKQLNNNNSSDKKFADEFDRLALEFRNQSNNPDIILTS